MSSPLLTKTTLVNLYKKENDPKVKERLLLIIKVREDKQIPFHVVKEMHRSNPWASNWLKRYDDKGIEGLQDRTKRQTHRIIKRSYTRLRKNYPAPIKVGPQNRGGRVNHIKKSGIKYHYTHIYCILRK